MVLHKLAASMPGTPEVDYPRPERLLAGNPRRETWNTVDVALRVDADEHALQPLAVLAELALDRGQLGQRRRAYVRALGVAEEDEAPAPDQIGIAEFPARALQGEGGERRIVPKLGDAGHLPGGDGSAAQAAPGQVAARKNQRKPDHQKPLSQA